MTDKQMAHSDMNASSEPLSKTASRRLDQPELPESLRDAVRGAEEIGRKAQEKAMLAMPFRARLRAREGVRPRTTLSIISRIDPETDRFALPGDSDVLPGEGLRLRRMDRPALALVPAAAASALITTTPTAPTVDASTPAQLGSGDPPGKGKPAPVHDDDDDAPMGFRSRLVDVSQFAFAGIAVLGLAGLSVMAADSALSSKTASLPADSDSKLDPFVAASTGATPAAGTIVSASSAELKATGAAPASWFDYRGVANLLNARKADADRMTAEAAQTERVRVAEADRDAKAAIAESEAKRLADQAASVAQTEAATFAAAETERQRLADADARAIAVKAEADRQAEAVRVEAARVEAETQLAAVTAQKKLEADAAARRVAAADAARKAAETKRLAELERQRLAALAADEQAEKLRRAKAASDATVRVASTGTAAEMVAFTGAAPKPATRKPAKPTRAQASTSTATLIPAGVSQVRSTVTTTRAYTRNYTRAVDRAVPQTLSTSSVSVRPLASNASVSSTTVPQSVADFIGERVQRTSAKTLSDAVVVSFRSDFMRLLETQADGARHTLKTPDGRDMRVMFEGSQTKDWSVRTVRYLGAADTGTSTYGAEAGLRYAAQTAPERAEAMCRDVSYAFPGQESGRFAACKTPDGVWTIARASDQTASAGVNFS